jgi:hypothetical protein
MKKTALLLTLILCLQFVFTQQIKPIDSIKTEKFQYKKLILPASLIAVGGFFKIKPIQNKLQDNTRDFFGRRFFTKVDDFTQYAPAAQMFAGNILGYKSKHGYLQMATNFAVSNVILTGSVFAIKSLTKDKRPDDTGNNSFPSGHTAIAFNNATLLFYEYKDSNFWYASSGYLFATATGILRVANNRHWNGDVFVGAGIGVVVGTVVSCWNPFDFDNKKSKIIGYPLIGENNYGLGLQYNLD